MINHPFVGAGVLGGMNCGVCEGTIAFTRKGGRDDVLHVACTRSRSMLCLCIVRIMHVEHSIQSHAAYRVLQTTVLCSYDTL